jgi:hypothetical protein
MKSVINDQFIVSWFGMDGSCQENEFSDLAQAQRHALNVSEHGGHSISIIDSDGDDYGF